MATQSPPSIGVRPSAPVTTSRGRDVPWPIWVIVTLLAFEGIGNALQIPREPMATRWLAAKILFIAGLIRGWRWVYFLFLVVAAYHVLGFGSSHPVVAGLNMLIVVLAACSFRYYFQGRDRDWPAKPPKKPTTAGFDPDFDA